MTTLTTASVLAFERKLEISDAIFTQIDSQKADAKITNVIIRKKGVRGTISNRLKNAIANDPTKLDTEIQKPNPQTIETATLDDDKDTLIARWSCKVLPFTGEPSVCNNSAYQAKLIDTVSGYLQQHGVNELARRYAANIVNARWLWRNRMGAETIRIQVRTQIDGKDQTLEFADAKVHPLNHFDWQTDGLNQLSDWIAQGLRGDAFVILYITAHTKVGYGQEVYPSQEMLINVKDKILYSINDKAGMHSQKISNAIRTIDTWYPNAQFPIAAEPYGAVTTLGTAFRQPKEKTDFYNLFDNWILRDVVPSLDQQHYIISVLIRGGVFGEAAKEKEKDNP